ncbi:MAG: DUF1254 domain-containing protein [Pseudomonadota bacterium]
MKRWIAPISVLIATAAIAHWATLHFAPSVIMDRALTALKDRGVALHAFTTPQRISPQTQVIVRSSPDLFYSLCRYDLSEHNETLKVTMGEWPDYQSLSFFDGNTINFAKFRGTGKSVTVRLVRPDLEYLDPNAVVSPTNRGVVLIRRLAPTQEAFDAAVEAAKVDSCDML